MKVVYGSDLHLEFDQHIGRFEYEDGDVLVLAGDIAPYYYLDRMQEPIQHLKAVFKKYSAVLIVLGNHDFYHGVITKGVQAYRDCFSECPNVHVLDNSMVDMGDVVFIGGTMWTDFNKGSPLEMLRAQDFMYDYRAIQTELGSKITGEYIYLEHQKAIKAFEMLLKDKDNVVMISHHAPVLSATHEDFKFSALNYAFNAQLDDFILEHPQIKYWIYGHTHRNVPAQVGETKIVANQRTYPGELHFANFDFKKSFVV